MSCPCENCITKAACVSRKLRYLLNLCPQLGRYLTDKWNGPDRVVQPEQFYEFCSVMGIETKKEGRNLRLIYSFEGSYPANTEMFDMDAHFAKELRNP